MKGHEEGGQSPRMALHTDRSDGAGANEMGRIRPGPGARSRRSPNKEKPGRQGPHEAGNPGPWAGPPQRGGTGVTLRGDLTVHGPN